MARIQSFAEQIAVARQATDKATRDLLVSTAKSLHNEVLQASGGRLPFTRYVDGRQGAIEDAVQTYGVIQYDYHRLPIVVQYAMEMLFEFSPVFKDEYRREHAIFLNGNKVRNLEAWETGDEVVITNPVPYSRKIENGSMSMRVPGTDHVYERAAVAVNRRYGNIARTRFVYEAGILDYVSRGARKTKAGLSRETRQPALAFDEYV